MNEDHPAPTLHIRSEAGDPHGYQGRFEEAFRLGRGSECDVSIPARQVSRVHAEALPYKGHWWIRDLDSTNGLLVNGIPTSQALLEDQTRIQLGRGGPVLIVSLEGAAKPEADPTRSAQTLGDGQRKQGPEETPATVRASAPDLLPAEAARSFDTSPDRTGPDTDPASATPAQNRPNDPGSGLEDSPEAPAPMPSAGSPLSMAEVQEKYLNPDSAQPAGDRTRMIRMAYGTMRKKEKRRSTLVLGGVLVLLAGAVAYGAYQRHRVGVLDRLAAETFQTMKSYEVQLVQLRQLAEETGSADLTDELARTDSLRRNLMEDYQGYVRERGLYRKLGSPEERLIFQTARLFGESEFAIRNSFIQAVRDEIEGYWLSTAGRERYREAISRAQDHGYTRRIVEALRRQGVPAEFFYLALQESDFNPNAVGPDTRWGRAKGMWQFIPTTARRYGLDPGPLMDTGLRDPDDDRQDFELASDAAARYLRDLHGVLTQASGLLVMAAYNWGEHRVAPRLEDLPAPKDVFQAEFAEVPTNPENRNYWNFLNEYEERMPEETKDYVLKIFSAAVIGQDPAHFGFEFENPLAPYLE